MRTLQFPKRISIHISPSYSSRSFHHTYSRATVIGILVGAGAFLAVVVFMLVYALSLYGRLLYVDTLIKRNTDLERGLKDLSKLEQTIKESERELERIQFMLGARKAQDTLDYTLLVFQYKPMMPENDSTDTLQADSTQIDSDAEGFYPQVPPVAGWIRITRVFSGAHPGIDFAASEGKNVFATADGIVADVGWDTLYGNYVKIQHGKYYETFYGHLQAVAVRRGDKVKMNDVVGFVGNTGRSSAPHLHFEVHHKGTPIDPATLFILGREYKGGAYD